MWLLINNGLYHYNVFSHARASLSRVCILSLLNTRVLFLGLGVPDASKDEGTPSPASSLPFPSPAHEKGSVLFIEFHPCILLDSLKFSVRELEDI